MTQLAGLCRLHKRDVIISRVVNSVYSPVLGCKQDGSHKMSMHLGVLRR